MNCKIRKANQIKRGIMYSNIILTAFGGVISMHISLTTWKVIVVVMLKNNDA